MNDPKYRIGTTVFKIGICLTHLAILFRIISIEESCGDVT